jgi:hypothetical protein
MPKRTSQRRSERAAGRGPTKRAAGLPPELTAQPRSVPDAIGVETSEAGLSIDADELGNRFLREATEQGDFDPTRISELESALLEDPTGDEPPLSQDLSETLWDRTVDLSMQTRAESEQLSASAPGSAEEYADIQHEPAEPEQPAAPESVRIAQSYVRELSLLDREGRDGADTVVPDIDTEDGGRHARTTPRAEPSQQVELPTPQPGPMDGRAAGLLSKVERLFHALMTGAAGWLRRVAHWLQPG